MKLRVGVIGTGFGRLVHIPGFQQLPDVEVVGVAGTHPEKARQVAREFGLRKCFTDWKELIQDKEIEAVTVATPPDTHEEITIRALEEGKAVLCEKPLALTARQAETMLQTAERLHLTHMTHFEFRAIPQWKLLKERIDSGSLGPWRAVQITWHVQGWADASRPWSWQCDAGRGGGVLGALASHTFDYVEWLFGPVRAISAQTFTRIPSRPASHEPRATSHEPRDCTAEDTVTGTLVLENGTPVSISISNVLHRPRGHWVEVYGEKGSLVLGSSNLKDYVHGFALYESDGGEPREVPLPDRLRFARDYPDGRLAPFIEIAKLFMEGIREQHAIWPGFREGVRSQLLCDAARRSHQEGRRVGVS